MNCLQCDKVTNLVASQGLGHTVRRWRECPKCGNKFHTYEIPGQILAKPEDIDSFVKYGVN